MRVWNDYLCFLPFDDTKSSGTCLNKTKNSHDGICSTYWNGFGSFDICLQDTKKVQRQFWIWRICWKSRKSPVFDETLSTSGLIPKARPIYGIALLILILFVLVLWVNRLQKADCLTHLSFLFEVDRRIHIYKSAKLKPNSRTEGFDVWNLPQNFGRQQQCYHQRTHW